MTPFTHQRFRALLRDESGAIMVDWVVLSSALVALAILVVMPVASSTEELTNETASEIATVYDHFSSQ
jgi:Flp pilus assembly pilin Flp